MTCVAQMNCLMSVLAKRGLPIKLTMLMPALLNRLKQCKVMQLYHLSVIGCSQETSIKSFIKRGT